MFDVCCIIHGKYLFPTTIEYFVLFVKSFFFKVKKEIFLKTKKRFAFYYSLSIYLQYINSTYLLHKIRLKKQHIIINFYS